MAPPEKLVLLLSGGGDSVALFRLLLELPSVDFSCLHFHHDSPGSFATEAAAFCRNLGARFGVAVEVVPLFVEAYQRGGDLSWEAAARSLRYREVDRRQSGKVGFLTAHTADDQAETVLMRLLDGSGLAGLAGIRPARRDGVLRPLLSARRESLREYLDGVGQPYLQDPTNLDGNDRARLRHRLLPLLEAERPNLVTTLVRTAETLGADEDALSDLAGDWLVRHELEGDHWPLAGLRALAPALRYRVVRELWRRASPSARRPLGGVFREVERLVSQGGDDRRVAFAGGTSLRCLGRYLWLEPELASPSWSAAVMESSPEGAAWTILRSAEAPVEKNLEDWVGRFPLPAEVFSAQAGYELRSRRPCDRYDGKSLKKVLATTGQPPWVRDRWPLLVYRGEVVAVPGLSRFSERQAREARGWLLFRPSRWRWRAGENEEG